MAFLCSGYWALLFCFASVQIGARGAALMQTTVESVKLRMEQIAELAKTPNVHKSKQQLEKITEDVKTLASQALIARSKSGNITEGGITDPLTKDALNIMKGSALGIVEQAESETDTLRALLSAAENDALACNVQVPALDTSYETNHDNCRTVLSDLYPPYALAKNTYESAVNAIRDTSGCVTKFVSNCSAWDAEFFALANYGALRSCLVDIAAWSSEGFTDVINKFGPYSTFVGQQPVCDGLQQQYEHAFCVHRLSKVTQCQENHRCYESNKATYDEQAALVVSTNDARRAAYAAGKKIECLVDKLLTDLSETAIASCENAQVDTSPLEIETQTLLTDPYSCPLTLEEVDAPCTPGWVSAYEDKTWYDGTLYSEYPLQCMSSCSANPGPRLWMEPRRMRPLYFPGEGFRSVWDSTSEPVYAFFTSVVSGEDPGLVLDDGSCRQVVEFPGGQGFENQVYRPNIEDYLELWVVFDGNIVEGEASAFILDSGAYFGNGLGFFYQRTDNEVWAYAAGQFASAVRPAASGLNVWRVQWKSSSYIAISINNKLLVNKTVTVSLRLDYSTLESDLFPLRLGMRSNGRLRSLQGRIAELQLFDRELTDYEANVTNLHFMTKYAVNGTKGGICT